MSERSFRMALWAAILLVFLGAVFGASQLAKQGSRAGNLGAAALMTASTIAIAVIGRRYARYPVWSYVTSIALLGVFTIGSAALWPDAAAWRGALKGTLWMQPWYFMLLPSLGPVTGTCGVHSARVAGWVLVGSSAIVGVVAPLIAAVF